MGPDGEGEGGEDRSLSLSQMLRCIDLATALAGAEMTEEAFNWLHRKCVAYLQNRTVYVMDVLAGHDPKSQMPVRIVTETAWHALFARTMFVRPTDEALKTHVPKFTIIHCPGLKADPALDGTKSSTFISLHMGRGLACIGGTHYAGEMKKCIFTVMNYYLPLKGMMTMHVAANAGDFGGYTIPVIGLTLLAAIIGILAGPVED